MFSWLVMHVKRNYYYYHFCYHHHEGKSMELILNRFIADIADKNTIAKLSLHDNDSSHFCWVTALIFLVVVVVITFRLKGFRLTAFKLLQNYFESKRWSHIFN